MSPASNEKSATVPIGEATSAFPDVPVSRQNPASSHLLFAPAEVDATTRIPVLLFLGSSLLWLLLGSMLGFLGSLKLVVPGLFDNVAFLTVGRLLPAAENSFAYGWIASAAIGTGLWIMSRLCRTPLRHGGTLTTAWALWNVGLTLGILGVLGGHGTGFKLLEFPKYASPIIFSAFIFIAIWVVLMFRYRRPGPLYVSQWMILAAFLWFPWVYGTTNLLLFYVPVQSAVQAVIHAWYLRSLLGIFFTLLPLAAAYYIVPKIMGAPIYRYGQAMVGFWGLLTLYSLSGAYYLIGGPVPAWMVSLSVVSNTLLLIPAVIVYRNLRGTMEDKSLAMRHSPSLRFTMVGVACFLAATILGVFVGFRSINAVAHFSLVMTAQESLALYAFVSMVLFGAVYYIVPRLLELEWPSPTLIRGHFWFSVVGVGLLVSTLTLGGFLQGLGLEDAKVPFESISSLMFPLLASGALCNLILLAGHVCFAASWMLIFFKVGVGAYETRRSLQFSRGVPQSSHVAPRTGDFAVSSVP